METGVKITLIIVGAIVLLAVIGLAVYFQIKPSQTVNVDGIAEVKAMPDKVAVYFNIETTGVDAKEAKDKNSEIVDNVITALIKLGFERKEITTESFNIYPEYNWYNNRQDLKDYKATYSLKVEFSSEETGKIGDVIDAGVDNGANINYINFELSLEKQNEYKAIALQQATEDAKTKAGGIASGLGKSVGRVVSISSSNFDYYPWALYNAEAGVASVAEAKAATTNIQPGEQTISGRVSVVFALK